MDWFVAAVSGACCVVSAGCGLVLGRAIGFNDGYKRAMAFLTHQPSVVPVDVAFAKRVARDVAGIPLRVMRPGYGVRPEELGPLERRDFRERMTEAAQPRKMTADPLVKLAMEGFKGSPLKGRDEDPAMAAMEAEVLGCMAAGFPEKAAREILGMPPDPLEKFGGGLPPGAPQFV